MPPPPKKRSRTKSEKPIAKSHATLAEIVGSENLAGNRMQAGSILDLIDVVAGLAAIRHAEGPVVTLSFDRVDLVHPIVHLNLVRLDARVVQVGRSSMMVAVDVTRQDTVTKAFIPIQHCFVTMVAIDAERRPNRNIPRLALESEEDRARNAEALRQKALSAQWVAMQEDARRERSLSVKNVEDPLNREKREFLLPEETAVKVRRIFMPRNLNVLGTIFGGDILLWMDRVATYTARLFTRNPHMVTLAMNRIYFKRPIFASDLVEMTARVVYVRRFTLEVEIEVTVQAPGKEDVSSHSGYFTVLNFDESGFKRPIVTGLSLDDSDQENLMRYHLARSRNRFWQEHRGKPAP